MSMTHEHKIDAATGMCLICLLQIIHPYTDDSDLWVGLVNDIRSIMESYNNTPPGTDFAEFLAKNLYKLGYM